MAGEATSGWSRSLRQGSKARETLLAASLCLALLVCSYGSFLYVNFGLGAITHATLATAAILALMRIAPRLVLSAVERFFPASGKRKKLKTWLLHFQVGVFLVATETLLVSAILQGADELLDHLGIGTGWIDLQVDRMSGIAAAVSMTIVGYLLYDLFFYLMHRWMHRSSFLWQHHKMHHMDAAFDAMTQGRQNWLEGVFIAVMTVLPMSILFELSHIDPIALGLGYGSVVFAMSFLRMMNHSSLRMQYGWASTVFTGPQVHRIHHSVLPQHFNKNFAANFPIWDILFGTYWHPRRDEFPPTGVAGEKEFETLLEAIVFTPREWLKWARARRDRVGLR